MPAGATKSLSFGLLIFNLLLYSFVTFIAGWAVNYGIENTPQSVSQLSLPAHLFPIYFPIGNLATPFFLVFSLVAGLVGIATSIGGIGNILKWNVPNLLSAAASSVITWSLTFLAMGLACKQINVGGERHSNLVGMEALIIILTVTQLFCIGAIHSGAMDVEARERRLGGRV